MALTKETKIDNVALVGDWSIQVREITIIKEDDVVISTTYNRKTLLPFRSNQTLNENRVPTGWVHEATDISGEDARVQALANASWTDEVKTAFKTQTEARGI